MRGIVLVTFHILLSPTTTISEHTLVSSLYFRRVILFSAFTISEPDLSLFPSPPYFSYLQTCVASSRYDYAPYILCLLFLLPAVIYLYAHLIPLYLYNFKDTALTPGVGYLYPKLSKKIEEVLVFLSWLSVASAPHWEGC